MYEKKGGHARIELSLETPETDKLLHLTGDYISIITITGSGTCTLKWNHRHSQAVNMREVTSISGVFDKLYITTDGGGGICSMYVGDGVALHVSPNQSKLWPGGVAGARINTDLANVTPLANSPFRMREVTISNTNNFYSCHVGPYNSNMAGFKSNAYILFPHETLRFGMMEMSALGCASYDTTHIVEIDVIGLVE